MTMKKMGKLLAVVLCLAMLFTTVAACGAKTDTGASASPSATPSAPATTGSSTEPSAEPSPSGPPVSAKDTITIAITQDRGTLDPLYTVGWDNQQCLRLVYEPLWEFDELYQNKKFVLATSIDKTDPLKWIIKLRDDVTFANGNPFTADDVVYSLWLANNRKGEPPYFAYMDNTETGTKAIDDYTVEVVFTQFNYAYENSFAQIFMYDKESYNIDTVAFETNGTGPYKVSEYVIQSNLNLTQRDDYWGVAPPIKNVNFKVLMEAAQRVNALETGEVDVSGVPFQDVEYVKGMSNLAMREAPARSDRAVLFNVTNPDCIFATSADARLAVIHAIDPASVLKIVYNGYGKVSTGPYTRNATDALDADFDKGIYDGTAYNPELAKQLAESSGLTKVTLTCINNGTADMVTVSELLQQALKEIGVTMNVQTTDAGSWLSYRFDDKAFDLCVDFTSGLSKAADLPLWWQYCGNCGTDKTKTPAEAARLRELTDAVPLEPDAAKRDAIISEMTDIVLELNYYYNLVDMTTFQAYDANLELPRTSGSWIDWANAYWKA